MPCFAVAVSSGFARPSTRRTRLLAGISALALLAHGGAACARPLGGAASATSAVATAGTSAATAQAAAAAAQASASLKRATAAIQAMQATQAAARAAAGAANAVPNGLAFGGLVPDSGLAANGVANAVTSWRGATTPTQTISGDRTTVTVQQTAAQAILNWSSFNVGAQTSLVFNQQGNRAWVALNRVTGSIAPSQILGNVKADGSVYVINQNGIIFGGGSQVNVGSLIASTAGITDSQFLSGGIYSVQSGANYLPSFTGATGKLVVEAGALIETAAPAAVTAGGGSVILLGAEVVNAGTIITPKGQTILAAGDSFILRRGYATDQNLSSTTRGSEIAPVIAANSIAGSVRNTGMVVSSQGDITLAGRHIAQDGVAIASTSVSTRGTIHVLNAASDALGRITFGADSLTTVIPELDSPETALNSQRDALIAASTIANENRSQSATGAFNNLSLLADRLDQSRIEIVSGGDVVFEGGGAGAGSMIIAQGGQIAVSATRNIVSERGATLNVSGVRDVTLAMASNNLVVNIQGNELRDSPQNRDSGGLLNQDVWVDIRNLVFVPAGTGGYAAERYYTPGGLLEVSGYLANTRHGVGEWSAVGGTITLSAASVMAKQGSVFDVSGGSVRYDSGYIQTSNFRGIGGELYNVNDARGDMSFSGVGSGFTHRHDRWGVTETWSGPFGRGRVTRSWEEGYTVGRDAGQLLLSTPTAVFEADIIADVVQGTRQTEARPDGATDGYKLGQNQVARAGTLGLGHYTARGRTGVFDTDVLIGDLAAMAPPADRSNTAWFDAQHINEQGLGKIDFATGDKITVAAPLSVADGGAVTFIAPAIEIKSDITARSGSITATNHFTTATGSTPTILVSAGTSSITVAPGVTLDTRGLWVNDALDGLAPAAKWAFIDGGDVRLVSSGNVTLAEGSLVDVSSGGGIAMNGKFRGGRGGNVTLRADTVLRSAGTSPGTGDGRLTLDGQIRGFGVTGGGTLSLASGATIVIGGETLATNGVLGAGETAPSDLTALQGFIVRAGEILPADYSYVSTRAQPGQAIGAAPDVSAANPITLAADWVPPPAAKDTSYRLTVNGTVITISDTSAPRTIPAGSRITGISSTQAFPRNYVVPANVFPAGIPIVPTTMTISVGNPAPVDVAFAAGTVIRAGSVLSASLQVRPLEYLGADVLKTGFAHYDITATSGFVLGRDATLDLATPAYRLSSTVALPASGADPAAALEIWTPPLYADNVAKGGLTQRAGADISINSLGPITLAAGSRITVDDGHSVALNALGQITIEGSITAHGGAITIGSDLGRDFPQIFATVGQSIWIGDHAVLDVAARAVTGVDGRGLRYGSVRDGGSINIGLAAFVPKDTGALPATQSLVIIRPGAVLDASGTSAVLDLYDASGGSSAVDVASNGGSILIGSMSGMVLDGTMRANAGGASAAGGSLTLALETPPYSNPTTADAPRIFTISASPRQPVPGLAPGVQGGLRYGEAHLSTAQVVDGGFDNLSLWSRDVFSFEGDVSLSMRQSLALYRGVLSPSSVLPAPNVTLAAPYVLLDGAVDPATALGFSYPGLNLQIWQPSTTNRGRLVVNADLIDQRNRVFSGAAGTFSLGNDPTPSQSYRRDFAGFASLELNSRGDVRLGTGVIASGGNDITIQAAQLYPITGAAAQIAVGMVPHSGNNTMRGPDGKLTIRSNGAPAPLPQSVFGILSLLATTIEQEGIVRAPLGTLLIGAYDSNLNVVRPSAFAPQVAVEVRFRAGSVTSTSAAGLVMPYGGTSDGLSYKYAGQAVKFDDLSSIIPSDGSPTGVLFEAGRIVAEPGALLDLSGGGSLTGAGFISGRGGSVDVIRTALVNANPAYSYSSSSNGVYALLPSYAGAYAPVSPDSGAGNPKVGQQITLTHAVGGLPAGTYTLLPASYALLPGAYRIEIGASSTQSIGAMALANGSYLTSGFLGVANTGIRSSLPSRVILTPAASVRTFSNYNETGYSDFALANAAAFGLLRPRLPVDGQTLWLYFGPNVSGNVLSFEGTTLMRAAQGGYDGFVSMSAVNPLEIKPYGSTATNGMVSINAEDISRFNAGTLLIGGSYSFQPGTGSTDGQINGSRVAFSTSTNTIVIRGGSVLRAGQIFAMARDSIRVEGGAVLDTTQSSTVVFDSSAGYVFSNALTSSFTSAPAVLTVANGWFNFLPPRASTTGTITIEDGAVLRTAGTIAFSASRALELGSEIRMNARYLTLSLPEINVGSEASFADARQAGALGSGWMLTQSVLDRLLQPADPTLARVERLTLTVGSSLNFFGDVALDASGRDQVLVLNAPAIYGWGRTGEVARLAVDTMIWNGISSGSGTAADPFVSLPPGAVHPGGPGTGAGALVIEARQIVLGYDPNARYQNETALNRLALGFADVSLKASDRVIANNRGTLSVYATGTDASSYAGGNLDIVAPLITSEAGAFMSFTAGGVITARAPAGGAQPTAGVDALGGEIRFSANQVTLDTAIALPSGRLQIEATGDVLLTDRSRIDLSGRAVTFFDVTKYSWGGDLVLESSAGAITQMAGAVIDVSALHNDAGSITADASGNGGTVSLRGSLFGAGSSARRSGAIDVRSTTLADFAELNARLNAGGLFGSRSFAIRTGDLVIGDEVRASSVSISVDGGSLTVAGRIDASGEAPGSIRLAARDDLVLAPSAVLDVHGTVLQVDSFGAPIQALNRGHVELTATAGVVRLGAGTTIDMRSPDLVSRGQIEINASRRGGTGGAGAGADDIAIDAAGPVRILGAASIAVNGFRRYELADGIVRQSLLDAIHGDSTAFIDAALGNGALQGRLAGLAAYGDAFHLRPGAELWSSGNVTTEGDIDLSGYRYGPDANSAIRGSGEPGVLTIRAGGNLTVRGSISDGFAPPPATPDDNRWRDRPRTVELVPAPSHVASETVQPSANFTLAEDWQIPVDLEYGFVITTDGNFWFPGDLMPAGSIIDVTGLGFAPFYWYAGMTVPAVVVERVLPQGQMWAVAPMLPNGSQSWSMRYVAGADLGAADSRSTGRSRGDIVLDDMHFTGPAGDPQEAISVLRTGTGYLDLLAGGDYRQNSLFGVYTAGTAVGSLPRATGDDGTVLGPGRSDYEAALNPAGIYFVDHGGDVLISARGNLQGYVSSTRPDPFSPADRVTSDTADWSWGSDGQWGINFGTYVATDYLSLRGFAGMGALGGGNVVIKAGRDAGEFGTRSSSGQLSFHSLVAAIGGGAHSVGGELVRIGGGSLKLDIGGRLGPGLVSDNDSHGNIANLRGRVELRAASVGSAVAVSFGVPGQKDPRPAEPLTSYNSILFGTVDFVLGDAAAVIHGRSDVLGRVLPASGLWTGKTSGELFSAGGDVNLAGSNDSSVYAAPSLSAVAASGNVLLSNTLTLAPSPTGRLELLAGKSVNGRGNAGASGSLQYVSLSAGEPFGNLHIDDPDPVRVYAVKGDISELQLGYADPNSVSNAVIYHPIGKRAWMRAGRDVFNSGGLFLNNRSTDVSIVSAGRDILMTDGRLINYNFQIAGPGVLEVSAGRNIYMPDGSFTSIGAMVPGDQRPGAGIVMMAGVGTAGPDYAALAALYLDPANLAVAGVPLTDQPGKVAKTYEAELVVWLKARYAFAGTADEAITFFAALASEQRNIFLREVYFAELKAGGREYNDPSSSRFGSYLRGREAIEALFPEHRGYGGSITMLDGSGMRTNFGGDIQMLAPDGQIIIGVEGKVPPSTAGVVTQGSGDIQLYSRGSILLGLSRIMTTFGGDILAWSAEGDINAGRGAKTTVIYTPPKRVYDAYGNVTLSPTVPSSGAGIATLSPIPQVPAGDVDLIAPLGTIDAGEAGIRVSGNVNLAALQIVNAGNVSAQGTSSGLPTVQGPPVAALTAANDAGGAAARTATPNQPAASDAPSIIIVEVLGFGGGDGSAPGSRPGDQERSKDEHRTQDPRSRFQVIGAGPLTEEQTEQLKQDNRNLTGR